MMQKNFIIFTLFILIVNLPAVISAKVDPPNYDFSLDALAVFKPDQDLETIKKKYPGGEEISSQGSVSVWRFYVAHIRYKFPVWVQLKNGKVLDSFATLPSYFLHDVFHQSIINRYGKQDSYYKKEENAVYSWEKKTDIKMVYSGSCTITCFPLYFSMIIKSPPTDMENYKPLIVQFDSKI